MTDEELMNWMIDGGWIAVSVHRPPAHELMDWMRPEWSCPIRRTRMEVARLPEVDSLYWRRPKAEAPEQVERRSGWLPWAECPPDVGEEIFWQRNGRLPAAHAFAGCEPPSGNVRGLFWCPAHAVAPKRPAPDIPAGRIEDAPKPDYTRIVHAWHGPEGTFFALDASGRLWREGRIGGWMKIANYPPGCDPKGDEA